MTQPETGEWYQADDDKWYQWPDPTPHDARPERRPPPPPPTESPIEPAPGLRTRPAWQLPVTLAVLAAGAVVAFLLIREESQQIDSAGIEAGIEKLYAEQFDSDAAATCPDMIENEKGNIFDCEVFVAGISHKVRVTLDDTEGHFHVEATS